MATHEHHHADNSGLYVILGIIVAVALLGLVLFFFTDTFRSGSQSIDVNTSAPRTPEINIDTPDAPDVKAPNIEINTPDAPDVNPRD